MQIHIHIMQLLMHNYGYYVCYADYAYYESILHIMHIIYRMHDVDFIHTVMYHIL